MSRVGNAPIEIPTGVTVEIVGDQIKVNGSMGNLIYKLRPEVVVEVVDRKIVVKRRLENNLSKSLHGLTRSLIANMIEGVEKGWDKKLELIGVGFRAQSSEDKLILNVGFSHPVEIDAPAGVSFRVEDNTKITVSGVNKELVGQVAAMIRQVRPPEPYQGKGIRYLGEYVRRKAGKAGKVGVGIKGG